MQADQGLRVFEFFLVDKYLATIKSTVMILSFQTIRSAKQCRPDQTAPRDQGLHCLLLHLHLIDDIPKGLASLIEFR